jgi:hypothetical protein
MALLVGFVGAVVLASAAGAHRTATALRRFIVYSRTSDAQVAVNDPTRAQLQAFRRVSEVADFAVLQAYALIPRGRPNLKTGATVDGRLGTAVDRARVVAGRAADPDAPGEIAIGEGLAAQQHLGLGDHLDAGSITLGAATADGLGNWTIAVAGSPLSDGAHNISARSVDLAGNQSTSGSLLITIVTTSPNVSQPNLSPASDTGNSNTDNLTGVVTPNFNGTAEPGVTVQLIEGSNILGTGTADASGNWSITSPDRACG